MAALRAPRAGPASTASSCRSRSTSTRSTGSTASSLTSRRGRGLLRRRAPSRSTDDPHVRGRRRQQGRPRALREVLPRLHAQAVGPRSLASWTVASPPGCRPAPTRDDRYFADSFQAMPLHGYTRMFERMLDHPNIKVMLNTDYRGDRGRDPATTELIYTGPIDEYFDYRYGKLPYRSLEFRHETLDQRVVPAGRAWSTIRDEHAVHAGHRVQAPDRPAAPEDEHHLRVPGGRRRSLLPGAAAGERRALQAVPGAGRRHARTSTSSAGWPLIGTTTWTRSSVRRSPSTPA